MGCHVEVSMDQPMVRSELIKLVSFLHVVKAIIFLTLVLIIPDYFVFVFGIVGLEILVSKWFWSMRIEAWGITMGFALLHLVFPVTIGSSLIVFLVVTSASIIEVPLLLKIRLNGQYSFITTAIFDKEVERSAGTVQKTMYNLTFLAQVLKVVFLLIGTMVVVSQVGWNSSTPWLVFIPQVPFVMILGVIDIIAAIAFRDSRDWGFQLTGIMAVLGFVEFLLSGSLPVLMLSFWIVMLLTPCWVKDGFYPALLKQFKKKTMELPEKESK